MPRGKPKEKKPEKKPILQYDHKDKTRCNNPPVGLVRPETDPDSGKKIYQYDPHLDPQLQWAGKAEHTSFDIDTVSLHVHERIDPRHFKYFRAFAPHLKNHHKTVYSSNKFQCKRVIAARYGSRGLAYLSTAYHAVGLTAGFGMSPGVAQAAMAAITQSQGPDLNRSVVDLQSTA